MVELIMSAGQKKIIFCPNSDYWSTVFFEKDDIKEKIGAQSLDKILFGFILAFMNVNEKKFFTYQKSELFTIVNLVDSLSVVAGRYVDDDLEIYHIQTDGNLVWLLTLDEKQRINFTQDVFKFIFERNSGV